jgi:two-component system NtrC family sensor kinase
MAETRRSIWDILKEITRLAPEDSGSPRRYKALRRNIIALMAVITILPLTIMAAINYYQYQAVLKTEIVAPIRVLVNKTKHSFELFLAERVSIVSFIASAYTYDQLADEKQLYHVFRSLRREFGGFVDLGLIDSNGDQITYVGPYDLKGKNYSEQSWFHEVRVGGAYISNVFMGYRRFPHVVIAVQKGSESGRSWIVRATIDTKKFDNLIAAMGLGPLSDAFLINREGILQTSSKFFGKVLERIPLPVPPVSYEPNVVKARARYNGEQTDLMVVYSYFLRPNFILMVVKPQSTVMEAWSTLKSELLAVFLVSVAVIVAVVFRLTNRLVTRMQESDEKRELAFREMEHTHKLSSVGRLAAGVAHEINNPLAIIDMKAGLMKDLIEVSADFPDKQKWYPLLNSILSSVERCRAITHRLLGFARRMDVQIEVLDLNSVVKEVAGFLEKECLYKNIDLTLDLASNLPKIASDRGQLQQVFLNIINNAVEAVHQGGAVSVISFDKDLDTVGVTIRDNGDGMSEETRRHIFEPFFTTKKDSGTGLGLSITYGIVKRLGGSIDVQSKRGEGTRFTVYLPKRAPELEGRGDYARSVESAAGGR